MVYSNGYLVTSSNPTDIITACVLHGGVHQHTQHVAIKGIVIWG